jgi:hypothetical protein
MINNSPSRLRKDYQHEKKTNILSFVIRNKSISPISSYKALSMLEFPLIKKSNSKSAKHNITKSLTKTVSRIDLLQEKKPDNDKLLVFLSELKQKLNYIKSETIYLEKFKEELNYRETELIIREKKANEMEKNNNEVQIKLVAKDKKLQIKEQDLKNKEKELLASKQQLFDKISQSLEKKSKEIEIQEQKIKEALIEIQKEIENLNKAKEEAIKTECCVMLNELIGCIVANDYQISLTDSKIDQNSFEDHTISEVCSSLNDFDKIDEISNETFYDESSHQYSFKDTKNSEFLKDCEESGKENKEISDKSEVWSL